MKLGSLLLIPASLVLGAPSDGARENFAGMPPVQYWGDAVTVVIFTGQVEEFCGKPPEGFVVKACAKETKNGTPVLVLPNPCYYGIAGEEFATLACHEKAHHPNDWAGDHPV